MMSEHPLVAAELVAAQEIGINQPYLEWLIRRFSMDLYQEAQDPQYRQDFEYIKRRSYELLIASPTITNSWWSNNLNDD